MPTDADVIIVGAGPAGSVAATLLARAGARVRLIDRAPFPRAKLCGDSVNPGALSLLRRLAMPLREHEATPINGMLVTGDAHPVTRPGARRGSATVISGFYPDGMHGLVISRQQLDMMLIEHAVAAGVAFEPEVGVTAPVLTSTHGTQTVTGIDVATGRGRRRLHARVTVAADGRRSRLAFALGLLRPSPRPRRWAIGAYAEQASAGRAALAGPQVGEMHIRPDGYLGVAPLPGGLTNLCVVTSEVPRGMHDPAAFLLAAFRRDPLLGERMRDARLVTPVTVLGPLAVEPSGADCLGVLTAGDAAGFIDPMTGDGLRFAIHGAALAATAAEQVLAHGWDGVHAALRRDRQRAFAGKWRFNRALRTLVSSPRAIQVAALAGRLAPIAVRALIAQAGDVDLARTAGVSPWPRSGVAAVVR